MQFSIILRRQRTRTLGKPKFKAVPSRFLNLSDDFEFAGWGSIFRIALSREDLSHVALVSAALLLLDFAATAVVSAATASSYLAGEVALSLPLYIGALLAFVFFAAVSLLGLRDSARIASGVLIFHVCHCGFEHLSR